MSYVYLLSDRKGLYYVGKTSDIRKRITVHKSVIRHQGDCTSRYLDIDFDYEILEEYSNEIDLAQGERKYYNIYREKYGEKLVNKTHPLRTQAEWYADNAEECKAQKRQYYAENAEEIRAKERQHYAENADKVKARVKQYQTDHAELIKAKAKQKYICECGGRYTHQHKTQHFKTQQHSDFTLHSN